MMSRFWSYSLIFWAEHPRALKNQSCVQGTGGFTEQRDDAPTINSFRYENSSDGSLFFSKELIGR